MNTKDLEVCNIPGIKNQWLELAIRSDAQSHLNHKKSPELSSESNFGDGSGYIGAQPEFSKLIRVNVPDS